MKHGTTSLWMETQIDASWPRLSTDLETDVVIIGAGISGITAAFLLSRSGKSVIVLDQSQVAMGESGRTTAHLTEAIDARYFRVAKHFGKEAAQLVARSSRQAIDLIESNIMALHIDCDYARLPGFLFAEYAGEEVDDLQREARAMTDAGIGAALVNTLPLDFPTFGAVTIPDQAAFHPRKYLLWLACEFVKRGNFIFENTRVEEINDGVPCSVRTDDGFTVHAKKVIVCTNSPNSNPVRLQTMMAAYRTYAMAVKLKQPPPPGLYWDMNDPYHYIRNYKDTWIIGGEDHKVGQHENTLQCFANLQEYIDTHFDVISIGNQWSGQIIEPVDGLPYIGLSPGSENIYVATGFSGNGITFGTIAGTIICDLIAGRANPYAELYSPSRIKPAGLGSFVSENVDYPVCLIRDKVRSFHDVAASQIKPDEAVVTRENGKSVALYRDVKGELHSVSATCTHMGCNVRWNAAEKSWDCPCHGSRFGYDGTLLNGPAVSGLKKLEREEAPREKPSRAA